MSHSFRHTPVHGICSAQSEKLWKRYANRALRVLDRTRMAKADPDEMVSPKLDEVCSTWSSPKDGKTRMDRETLASPTGRKLMRK